ncbi:hypothetical protein F5146DRAFT_301243 [Armillaria mellea]|nr:hypothetical protein F5146DRAFT_301243 [Armillaria mellea]
MSRGWPCKKLWIRIKGEIKLTPVNSHAIMPRFQWTPVKENPMLPRSSSHPITSAKVAHYSKWEVRRPKFGKDQNGSHTYVVFFISLMDLYKLEYARGIQAVHPPAYSILQYGSISGILVYPFSEDIIQLCVSSRLDNIRKCYVFSLAIPYYAHESQHTISRHQQWSSGSKHNGRDGAAMLVFPRFRVGLSWFQNAKVGF